MKKFISCLAVAVIMLSTVSFAQTKKAPLPKKVTPSRVTPAPVNVPAPRTMPKPAVQAISKKKADLVISPKAVLYTGSGGSSFAIGCEVSKPIMDNVDIMGEAIYVLPSGGTSNIVLAVNGIYNFDVKGLPGDLYAGGGLNYNILSGSGFSSSGLGFQGLAGMDFKVGDGKAYGQLKYVSYSYSIPGIVVPGIGTIGGGTVTTSGLVVEGGYRFEM